MSRDLTHIMIIGAMKAGTSSLFNYLSEHPAICPAITKEPNYFSTDMRYEKHRKNDYLGLFDLKAEHKFTLDGSTSFTKYPEEKGVPQRIRNEIDQPIKFIYIVRDPFERIESHFNFMMKDPVWKAKIDDDHLINTSNYYLQLDQYLQVFSKPQFKIIDFEDLKMEPKKVLDGICQFLGTIPFKTYPYLDVVNATPPINRQKVFIKDFLSKFLGWLPQNIKSLGSRFLSIFLKGSKSKLTDTQLRVIHDRLNEDMLKLGEQFHVDVEKWGFIGMKSSN